MRETQKWANVRHEIPCGIIVSVDADSPMWEKEAIVQFSEQTEHVLGTFVRNSTWEIPGIHAFAAVADGVLVGCAIYDWITWVEDARGNVLDIHGRPIPRKPGLVVKTLIELLNANLGGTDNRLEAWCLEAVVVIPEYQRKGIGKALLQTAATILGAELKEIAISPPIHPPGEALLRSMGLDSDLLRRGAYISWDD